MRSNDYILQRIIPKLKITEKFQDISGKPSCTFHSLAIIAAILVIGWNIENLHCFSQRLHWKAGTVDSSYLQYEGVHNHLLWIWITDDQQYTSHCMIKQVQIKKPFRKTSGKAQHGKCRESWNSHWKLILLVVHHLHLNLIFLTHSFISKIRYFDRESFGQRLICQTNKKNSFQRVSRSCEYYKELGPHENNKTTMLPSIYNCLISPCETSLLSVKVQN